MKYTDQVPLSPGWYWERRKNGVRILEIPYLGCVWPHPWQEKREEQIKAAPEEEKEKLLNLPLDTWKIEYAGPISEPEN